jgi:hypothetical protein
MPPGSFAQKLKQVTRSKEDLVCMPHARVGAGHQDIWGPMQWAIDQGAGAEAEASKGQHWLDRSHQQGLSMFKQLPEHHFRVRTAV